MDVQKGLSGRETSRTDLLRLRRRPTSSGRIGWSGRRAACCGAASPIPLTPKAFDTLLALVERRDRVVDKAELMRIVWPDSFVEEANLSQTIFVLRKTLGEGPDGRPFIDTVPRRGYRFARRRAGRDCRSRRSACAARLALGGRDARGLRRPW